MQACMGRLERNVPQVLPSLASRWRDLLTANGAAARQLARPLVSQARDVPSVREKIYNVFCIDKSHVLQFLRMVFQASERLL